MKTGFRSRIFLPSTLLLFAAALLWAAPLSVSGAPASRGIGVVKKKTGGSPFLKGEYYALVIGNNQYKAKKWPTLKTAVVDAKAITKVLLERYGFPKENVFLRTNATRRELLQGLNTLVKKAKEDDNVFIYYAGHGEFDEHQRGWWIPVDAEDQIDYISNDDILGTLRSIKAKHKLLVSDSCFSGNLLTRSAAKLPPQKAPSRFVLEKSSLRSVQGFSSGGNEPVSDGGPQWEGHSIFAFHLLAQLKANQEAYLSAQLLGYKVAQFVANDTASAMGQGQTPIFSAIKGQGDQGGEFFFYLPNSGGGDLSSSVALVFSKPSANFGPVSEGARKVVLERIMKSMESIPMRMVGEAVVLESNVPNEALTQKLIKQGAKGVLVVGLDGERTQERTLLWQGHATLTIELNAYRIKDGKLAKSGDYKAPAQRLPIRQWSDAPDAVAQVFTKTAEKFANRASHNSLSGVLSSIQE